MPYFTRKQCRKGGKASQDQRKAAKNRARSAELAAMAAERGGFARICQKQYDTHVIETGALAGKEFFSDTKPEAFFNDGTWVGDGEPWFLPENYIP